jgi:hypothetical protein
MRTTQTSLLRRVFAWATLSIVVLGAGFVSLVAALASVGYLRTGNFPGELQRHAWFSVMTAVFMQALAPLWGATLLSWLALVRVAPRLDASWRTLALGIAGLAAVWFAPVGAYCFQIWTPGSARDVVGTLALCAGGVSAALLLPRAALRALAPGALS